MTAATIKAIAKDKGTELAEERTSLAIERSRIAAERTMMAWIRTSLSMISFGFSIHKFFQYLRESNATQNASAAQGPRNLGVTLICLGVFVLIVSAFQHWHSMKSLEQTAGYKLPRSLSLGTATVLALAGTLMLFNLLFRFGPF